MACKCSFHLLQKNDRLSLLRDPCTLRSLYSITSALDSSLRCLSSSCVQSTDSAAMTATQPISPEWARDQVLQAHNGQVAGHPGTLQALKGPNGESLIVKEGLPSEIAFYEALHSQSSTQDDAVRDFAYEWTPKYYGSLPAATTDAAAAASEKPRIIIEDLLSGFQRPNVIDVKLGTQLWDENSSEDKKERMDKASRETTSFETGIRLTGWRVSRAESKGDTRGDAHADADCSISSAS